MTKYEFMLFSAGVTLDYIADELSKLVNAEVVSYCQTAHGMSVLIKVVTPKGGQQKDEHSI